MLFNSPKTMVHLSPEMQKTFYGWPPDHSPYFMFDFDDKGQLIEYPPDPDYGAFMEASNYTAKIGNIPFGNAAEGFALYDQEVEKSYALFKAIIKERYQKAQAKHNGKLALVTEWFATDQFYPENAQAPQYSYDYFNARMGEIAGELGMATFRFPQVAAQRSLIYYENDGHPSPTGHYKIAEALAGALLSDPELAKKLQEKPASQ